MSTGTQERQANLPATTNGERRPAVPVAVAKQGVVLTSLDEMWRFASCVHASGMAPKNMGKEALVVAIQLGLELGLSPMSAIQNIGVINGKPGIYGDAALALVRDSRLCEFFWETESDSKIHALVEGKMAVAVDSGDKKTINQIREQISGLKASLKTNDKDFGFTTISKRTDSPTLVSRFTVEEATTAGLWDKAGPWKQYPKRMLRFRSRGFNLRDNFADVLKGLRTAEEVQDIPCDEPAPRQQLPLGRSSLKRIPAPPTVQHETMPETFPDGEIVEHVPEQQPESPPVQDEAQPAPPEPTPDDLEKQDQINEVCGDIRQAIADAETSLALETVGKEINAKRSFIGDMAAEDLIGLYQVKFLQLTAKKK